MRSACSRSATDRRERRAAARPGIPGRRDLQVVEAAREQPRAGEQQHRERDLRRRPALGAPAPGGRRRRRCRLLPSAPTTTAGSRGRSAGPMPEEQRREHGASSSAKRTTRRSGSPSASARRIARQRGQQEQAPGPHRRAARPTTAPGAPRAAGSRPVAAGRSGRVPAPSARRMAISFCRAVDARQQQVGDVRARDQQHDADHAHQHERAASRTACADRTGRAPPGQHGAAWRRTAGGSVSDALVIALISCSLIWR